jgi:hypothetical protein
MSHARFIFLALALTLAACVIAISQQARADAQQTQNFAAWRQMQVCAKQATKQFPDYTPEGKVKREAARQECLRANHLPVTEPVPTPPPPR